MTSIRKVIQTLTVLALIFGMVGPLGVPSAMAAAHAHPLLLQMASEAPEQQVAVIVQKSDKSDQAEALVRRLGGEVTKDLHIINAFAAEMDAGAALELARDPGVRWVSLDAGLVSTGKPAPREKPDGVSTPITMNGASVQLPANFYLDTMNVRQVWNLGYRGEGVGVAVIDTGITPDADFSQEIGSPDSRIVAQASFNANAVDTNDSSGHGTHVAGIIGGNGSSASGFYQGVAPMADLINLKIGDENGLASESDAVAAMQWVYENKAQYNIRVVNLSFQTTVEMSYHQSPVDAAAEILWFNGVVVVAASGNWDPQGVYSPSRAAPANDPFLITVGAFNEKGSANIHDDSITKYTAFGNTQEGYFKPEIYAPGMDIISTLASDSPWAGEHPDHLVVPNEYMRLSGSSMAAPMVSGAAALLLQAEPDLTPDQVKYRLIQSARWANGLRYMDVYTALTAPTTGSANTGLTVSQLLWTGSEPITWTAVAWNAVAWNAVAWNAVAWNAVAWNNVYWGP